MRTATPEKHSGSSSAHAVTAQTCACQSGNIAMPDAASPPSSSGEELSDPVFREGTPVKDRVLLHIQYISNVSAHVCPRIMYCTSTYHLCAFQLWHCRPVCATWPSYGITTTTQLTRRIQCWHLCGTARLTTCVLPAAAQQGDAAAAAAESSHRHCLDRQRRLRATLLVSDCLCVLRGRVLTLRCHCVHHCSLVNGPSCVQVCTTVKHTPNAVQDVDPRVLRVRTHIVSIALAGSGFVASTIMLCLLARTLVLVRRSQRRWCALNACLCCLIPCCWRKFLSRSRWSASDAVQHSSARTCVRHRC